MTAPSTPVTSESRTRLVDWLLLDALVGHPVVRHQLMPAVGIAAVLPILHGLRSGRQHRSAACGPCRDGRAVSPTGGLRRGGGAAGGLRSGRDEGSMALELAIVMPVIIVLLLTVVALGRYSHSGIVVEQAAAAAARAASLTATPGAAATAARDTAAASLHDAGLSCASMTTTVDTSTFRPGGQVKVTVTCRTDLSDLALTGVPGTASLTSSAAAPLEHFRPLGRGR